MTDGNRSKRNRRIRFFISQMVDSLQPGDRITTQRVLVKLKDIDGRWDLHASHVGILMRDYEDLKHVGVNTWEKVPRG